MHEFNGIQIKIVRDYDALSRAAADRIIDHLKRHPGANLLVPTGTTPEGVYRLLRDESQQLFRSTTLFNMDEYCREESGEFHRIPSDDPRSYRRYMHERILKRQPQLTSFFPDENNVKNPGSYDRTIEERGGISLCVNAIGEDGHTFGFNLPGSSFDSHTRLVEINQGTSAVNEKLTGVETPTHAITAGLATGMASREVLMLVSGARKAAILREVIYGEITQDVPATILRRHQSCTWIVDEAAASRL